MAPVNDPPDETLLRRIAGGDLEAMGVLFRRRQQNVYRFALHLTGSPVVADDVTQDVFVTAIRDAARFEPGRATVVAWLCGMARNFVRRRLASERDAAGIDDGGLTLPVVSPDPLGDLTRGENIEMLRRAILTLPLVYREAIVLCDLQELSYADAAAAIGCAVGTVRSRLHRGRVLLAAKVQVEQRRRDTETPRAAVTRCLA